MMGESFTVHIPILYLFVRWYECFHKWWITWIRFWKFCFFAFFTFSPSIWILHLYDFRFHFFSTVNGHLLSVSDDLSCKIKVFNFYYLLGCRSVTVLMFTCFVGLCIFFRRMPVNFIVQEICSLEQWHSKIKKKI